MRIFDISVTLKNSIPAWPGEKGFSMNSASKENITVSEISMGIHTGTHVDAPYHFLPDGKQIDELPLDKFIGPARVCLIQNPKEISEEELKKINIDGCKRLLFKTDNSLTNWEDENFSENYIALSQGGADYLAEKGVSLIGVDYLSVEPFHSGGNVHTTLLNKEIALLEGLNLKDVPEGDYFLFSAPLKIRGGEGSPVRAILIPMEDMVP